MQWMNFISKKFFVNVLKKTGSKTDPDHILSLLLIVTIFKVIWIADTALIIVK